MPIRLQKLLSMAGVASRRAAEQLMLEGRVSVNGEVVRELGSKAEPTDEVRVDGRRIHIARERRYLLLNKPRGYVTTRSDPERRQTVLDLVPRGEYLYPVGRLDYDSEGLLLLTNDGELADRLTHPRHGVERVYHARVRGVPDAHDVERISRGVTVEGRRTRPARVRLIETGRGRDGDQAVLEIAIAEGRTRQVREMCEAIGHPIVRLRRVRIGPLADPRLPAGHWRELTREEVRRLKTAASARDSRPDGPTSEYGPQAPANRRRPRPARPRRRPR